MRRWLMCFLVLLAGVRGTSALASEGGRAWGLRGSLGLSTGDLKDTATGMPCLGLGAFLEQPLSEGQGIQARLDHLSFRSQHRVSSGTTSGSPWVRNLDTQVKAWALGAEYLVRPVRTGSRLQLGAGVHLVRWTVDNTSRLDLGFGSAAGTVQQSSSPGWTKLGLSLVARYRLSRTLQAEARVLSSSYGWEGEQVQIGQLGLSWTF